jgi:predicted Zn-dependent protease
VETAKRVDQTQKEARRDVEPKEEYFIGRSVAARVLQSQPPIDIKSDYLNRLVGYVAAQSRRPVLYKGYSVQVINSKDPLALTTSGGHIMISNELIKRAGSEDALAGLIAHEVSHLALGHHADSIWRSRMLDRNSGAMGLAQSATAGSDSSKGVPRELAVRVVQFLADSVLKKWEHRHEFQADIEAVRLLHRVGYDPKPYRDLLAGAVNQADRWTASTHPPTGERLKAVDQEIARLQAQQPAVSARGPASEVKAVQARTARFQAFLREVGR